MCRAEYSQGQESVVLGVLHTCCQRKTSGAGPPSLATVRWQHPAGQGETEATVRVGKGLPGQQNTTPHELESGSASGRWLVCLYSTLQTRAWIRGWALGSYPVLVPVCLPLIT